MFSINKINTKADTATKPVDHLAEMKAAIDTAINAAESAGVKPAAMIEYFKGCLNYTRQRALHGATKPMRRECTTSMGISLITPGTSHERGQYAKNRSAWPVNASGRRA